MLEVKRKPALPSHGSASGARVFDADPRLPKREEPSDEIPGASPSQLPRESLARKVARNRREIKCAETAMASGSPQRTIQQIEGRVRHGAKGNYAFRYL